ncbi:Kinesin-like protein KIF27 [Trichoplax sp. H2]|nr:Kinesin-like protein KIF27 [Trichoplax sp. H2]|eukprot:RDD40339.1 Kinesin-like protein KIF27 [Trichoplax sp. H2]
MSTEVPVRVRPLLPQEKLQGYDECIWSIPNQPQVVIGKNKSFTFDYAFSQSTTQTELFENCVEPLLQNCFEGYNVTIFAYGQTGSGKTYTIGGANTAGTSEEEAGIISRAIKRIFEVIQANSIDIEMKVSYIEIYREEMHDLLDVDSVGKEMHIRDDSHGNTVVTGAREENVDSAEEALHYLDVGSLARHTGATAMNEQSSRSHSIFTVTIEQRWNGVRKLNYRSKILLSHQNESDGDIQAEDRNEPHFMCSKFHFVDLAGSERSHKAGTAGLRFKESVHINSGLLALGNVISALGDSKKKYAHVPYRDSKLTRLLKDSLGGNSRTLMLTCLSPASSNFAESLNALNYANRARNIKNKPIVNIDPRSLKIAEMQSEIQSLRDELEKRKHLEGETEELTEEDGKKIQTLETQLDKYRNDCIFYYECIKEAKNIFSDLEENEPSSDMLSQTKMNSWLDLIKREEKVRISGFLPVRESQNDIIQQLREELIKLRADLASDEEIFAEKIKEVDQANNRLESLQTENRQYKEALEHSHRQNENLEQRLLELQLKLIDENPEDSSVFTNVEIMENDQDKNVQYHHLPKQLRSSSMPCNDDIKPLPAKGKFRSGSSTTRNLHSSPAVLSGDKMLQTFRARSRILESRIEDEDEVLRPNHIDDEELEKIQQKDRYLYRIIAQKESEMVPKSKANVDIPPSNSAPPFITEKDRSIDDEYIVEDSLEKTLRKSVNQLQFNTDSVKINLKESQARLTDYQHQIRSLSTSIRIKEDLIHELKASRNEMKSLNKTTVNRINTMKSDNQKYQNELTSAKAAIDGYDQQEEQDTNEKKKLEKEYQTTMKIAEERQRALEKLQAEYEHMNTIHHETLERIDNYAEETKRMHAQIDISKAKLKEEAEIKARLEETLRQQQDKLKELQQQYEEEQAKPKLNTSMEREELNKKKAWLDSEVEKIIQRRRDMEDYEEEIRRREEIVSNKESLLSERSNLELIKLRSSQAISKDILRISTQIDTIDKDIDDKSSRMSVQKSQQLQNDISKLYNEKEKLLKNRNELDENLRVNCINSPEEEHKLLEMDEAIEALNAAIEFKNEAIKKKKRLLLNQEDEELGKSGHSIRKRLDHISEIESKELLQKYIDKQLYQGDSSLTRNRSCQVVDLREDEKRKEKCIDQLKLQIDEQGKSIAQLELSLQLSKHENDRKLMYQQKEYEKKMQHLMKQLSKYQEEESKSTSEPSAPSDTEVLTQRIKELEKDLFYYKRLSREMKKKVRDTLNAQQDQKAEKTISAEPSSSTSREKLGGTYSLSGDLSDLRSKSAKPPRSARPESSTSTEDVTSRSGPKLAPVRINRKDLRQISDDEANQRRKSSSTKNGNDYNASLRKLIEFSKHLQ